MPGSRKVRVAIVGVGNCASALVQGTRFYRNVRAGDTLPGLMHSDLGGYLPGDIEFSAAFDIDVTKVGKDLSSAIFAPPNNTIKFAGVPRIGVRVQRGPTLDGVGEYVKEIVKQAKIKPVNVAQVLRKTRTDVLVSYLPVGSQKATEFYMQEALRAGCGVVNCVPVFIASDKTWRKRFERANLPIIGDDIKSQFGATILHRQLTRLLGDRALKLDRTYQLNCGGNTDFLNMLERKRLSSKKISKTQAVVSQLDHSIAPHLIHVGPSDYVAWLEDRKVCFIQIDATGFGGVPIKCEVKLEVWDSPNSAGVVIDAIRCVKLAKDRGIGGALEEPSSWLMKSPPKQYSDSKARELMQAFISA